MTGKEATKSRVLKRTLHVEVVKAKINKSNDLTFKANFDRIMVRK